MWGKQWLVVHSEGSSLQKYAVKYMECSALFLTILNLKYDYFNKILMPWC